MIKDTKYLFDTKANSRDFVSYQRLIGKLLYLTNTILEISYDVQSLS